MIGRPSPPLVNVYCRHSQTRRRISPWPGSAAGFETYPFSSVLGMDQRMVVMAEAVDACAAMPLWPLDPAGCVDALDAVVAAERTLAGLKLRLIRRIDAAEVAKHQGATSLAVWLRGRYR